MTENDIAFFRLCHSMGIIKGPLLEVGAAKVVPALPNLCDEARRVGVRETLGADMQPYDGVDVVCDFGTEREVFRAGWDRGQFATVCVFNVLEHTFDPIGVLRNALECTRPDGNLVVLTPVVWPLHSHPGDYVRLLPNWYEEFAKRHGLEIHGDLFRWVSQFGLAHVRSGGEYELPTWITAQSASRVRSYVSRAVHKAFDTYGRSHTFTHAALGVVMRRVAG